MLAIGEKQRAVLVLSPDFIKQPAKSPEFKGLAKCLADDVCVKLDERYLEVKCRKTVYISKKDADSFFHYMPVDRRKVISASFNRGLCEIVIVEHLDGDAINQLCEFMPELMEDYEEGIMLYSASTWESMRYIEFFFPHLDFLPRERTLALVIADTPHGKGGQSLEEAAEAQVAAAGLLVVARRTVVPSQEQAELLCEEMGDGPEYQAIMQVLLSTEKGALVMCLEGRGAIGKWQLVCGPKIPELAREIAPTTLRAEYVTEGKAVYIHGSETLEAAERELHAYFDAQDLKLQRTVCMIKPDAMQWSREIREEIEEAGFTIIREEEVTLTEERATEFYESHRGTAYFKPMIKEATSGPCIVAVLCRFEAISVLQELMGPASVKEAKRKRPTSLRARYGRDGQRNAVHGSDSERSAASEVRFFFPEMGSDPAPSDGDEVRDFLFRKSALASSELRNISTSGDASSFNTDPTLQQLLCKGCSELAQVKPKGLGAIKWLSRWLAQNNPNNEVNDTGGEAGLPFQPPVRQRRFIQHGVNKEGLAFEVEPPAPVKTKRIIDVDVSEEQAPHQSDFITPPYVVCVCGGPGAGKGTQCAKLREEFNFVHLSTGDLMREEVAAESYLGTEIFKYQQSGALVPDSLTLQLLKENMLKYQDTNRFLLDGFPRTLQQALKFEQDISEIAFILYLDAQHETLRERLKTRREQNPGRFDDADETIEKRLNVYAEEGPAVLNYYTPIGKVRSVSGEKSVDEVYTELRRYTCGRFIYLLGAPGVPLVPVAEKMEATFGYSVINVPVVLQRYAESAEEDAVKVKQALSKGVPVDASIIDPLVIAEIYRDMALGIQNFVLIGFPQTRKQAEFLEFRIPGVYKPLLLDFFREDAKDLAAASGMDAVELEMRTNEFYEGETRKLWEDGPEQLRGLMRVPCSLASIANSVGSAPAGSADAQADQKVIDATWSAVRAKVTPSLNIVLGPPCSGTTVLAGLLAGLTPNTQSLDCNLLLDRELERRTESGTAMHNLLARGQVVPFSMTLDLLKGVVGLTCSDSLVIENSPMYVDQIEYITREFSIDRVFFINGTEKALAQWKADYASRGGSGDASVKEKAFDARMQQLMPIILHFARQGKLDRIEVNDTPKEKKLVEELKRATVPQFVVVTGMSTDITEKHANILASAFGVGPPITSSFLVGWAASKLPARTVNPDDPREFFSALKKYADTTKYPLLVLEHYPSKMEDAAAFIEEFGCPKLVVTVDASDEVCTEEITNLHKDDENPPSEEAIAELLSKRREALDGTFGLFKEKCPPSTTMVIQWNPETSKHDEISASIRERLRPGVFAIVAPRGAKTEFGKLIANAICISKREGKRPLKYTVVDSAELVKPEGHSAEIQDQLAKATFAAESAECLPANLWVDLFQEAFRKSANPMGTFLVTNFPTASSLRSSPTLRDQFHLLSQAGQLVGIVYVRLTDDAFRQYCSDDPEDLADYKEFSEKVHKQGKVQLDPYQICEVTVGASESLENMAAKVADDFRSFQEKAEQGPPP
eukprot:TRINITY_DN43582_c0_g1_i1.p1 TRINITY_DN43582_c0_g1~~TRINITY_DN43582_c0_g1_i1.p1  ORF type:complete len:1526 (-),score=310.58 TRINITY_DN43582_c0_g1_i1:82-4659(-)